jgi:catechol 2,3-dioxygenase-like lactoylglutathione lyase family enzyme
MRRPRPSLRPVRFALLAVVWLASGQSAPAAVTDVERISLTVADLDQTEAFYRDGLGFRTVGRGVIDDRATEELLGLPVPAETLTMELGGDRVEFIRFRDPGRGYPVQAASNDLWFQHFAIVAADMDAAYARLRTTRFLPISTDGPQTLPEEDGRVRAFKFRDPDGHSLELICFPPRQGRPVWSRGSASGPTLGIDHTAISVSSTKASEAFYARLLGMKVAYEVVNRGPAQEHLDGTFAVMVRITGLRPASADGPGIELLDYRSPSTGRPPPPDTHANDLWHAHVVLKVESLDEMVSALDQAGVRFVSPGIVQLPRDIRAVQVLDPDGHAVMLKQ